MLLTVALSTYDDEQYLDQCLKAIVNQSFKDFELIIVNDASPDDSERIIRAYQQRDSRIKYIKNEKNLGIVKNINYCCSIAEGKYFYVASSDDWVHPDFFQTAIDQLETFQAALCFLETNLFYPKKNEYVRYKAMPNVEEIKFYSPSEALDALRKGYYVPTASAIVSTSSFVDQGIFSEELDTYCDIISLNYIAGKEGFVYVPREGVSVRVFPWHAKKYNPPLKEKWRRGLKALNYFLHERDKFNIFCQTLMLPRSINYKFFPVLLYPKYWPLIGKLFYYKFQLLQNRLLKKSFFKKLFKKGGMEDADSHFARKI